MSAREAPGWSTLVRSVIEALDTTRERDPLGTFLPFAMHGEMLRDEVLVVRGERGAGKTALFKFLGALQAQDIRAHQVLSIPDEVPRRWIDGFAEDDPRHPAAHVVQDWAAEGADERSLERFWLGHLVGRLATEGLGPPADALAFFAPWQAKEGPEVWVDAVGRSLSALYRWLDGLDQDLGGSNTRVVVGYDDLDRFARGPRFGQVNVPLARALASVWLGLSRRYRFLRGKLFLRPDLLDGVMSAFPDASKLGPMTRSLEWQPDHIYRLLFHRLAQQAEVRRALAEVGLHTRRDQVLGYVLDERASALDPPGERQLSFFSPSPSRTVPVDRLLVRFLAGDNMGTGPNKGYTHTWILNHSSDGLRRCLPRVTLNLVREAARAALGEGDDARSWPPLLRPAELTAGERPAGGQRLFELRESHPEVARLEGLKGREVPLDEATAVQVLGQARPEPDDGYGSDGAAVFERLVKLGVMVRRAPRKGEKAWRADVPDIFRKPYAMSRRGGPLQLRR